MSDGDSHKGIIWPLVSLGLGRSREVSRISWLVEVNKKGCDKFDCLQLLPLRIVHRVGMAGPTAISLFFGH